MMRWLALLLTLLVSPAAAQTPILNKFGGAVPQPGGFTIGEGAYSCNADQVCLGTLPPSALGIPGTSKCVRVDSGGAFALAATDCATGGSSVILDLGDDGSNESTALGEVATVGDTNSIFTMPTADKLLVDLTKDWPKADTADDLTCTNCIGATEIDGASLESEIEAVADLQDFQGALGTLAQLGDLCAANASTRRDATDTANECFVAPPQTRTISTTSPLSGGDDLSANRTFSIGGLSSLGLANQLVAVNSGATAWEYKTVAGVASETNVTHGAGTITIGIVDPLAIGKGGTGKASWTANRCVRTDGSGNLAEHSGDCATATGDIEAVWGCTSGDCSNLIAALGDSLDASLANKLSLPIGANQAACVAKLTANGALCVQDDIDTITWTDGATIRRLPDYLQLWGGPDNAIIRAHGAGAYRVQDTNVLITDANEIELPGSTSGTTKLVAAAAAGSGTLTLPASVTSTLVSNANIDTSVELAAILTDETGTSGGFVRADAPTLSNPIILGGTIGLLATLQLPNSTSLPGTCSDAHVYQDTDSGGSETSVCTATNTWTKLVGASGLAWTDNRLVRSDGTGGNVQESLVTISDDGRVQTLFPSTTGTSGPHTAIWGEMANLASTTSTAHLEGGGFAASNDDGEMTTALPSFAVVGVEGTGSSSTANTTASMAGVVGLARKIGTGGTTWATGGYFRCDNSNATGTITNCAAVYLGDSDATGAITNDYGIYQESTEPNRLGGPLHMAGSTSGTTILQPAAVASGTLTLPAVTATLAHRSGAVTDNRIARWDGTGGGLQDSGVLVTDANVIDWPEAEADKIYLWGTSYGIGITAFDFASWTDSSGNFTWRESSRTGTQLMALNAVGLSIGSTSPSTDLHVRDGSAESNVLIESAGASTDAVLRLKTANETWTLRNDESDSQQLELASDVGDRVLFPASGDTALNVKGHIVAGATAAAAGLVRIVGNGTDNDAQLRLTTASTDWDIYVDESDSQRLKIGSPSATPIMIETTGEIRLRGFVDLIAPTASSGLVRSEAISATNDDPTLISYKARLTTSNATTTTIWSTSINGLHTTTFNVHVNARRTGGTAGTAEDGAGYWLTSTWKVVGGTATQIGTTTMLAQNESQPAWNVTFTNIASSLVAVQVTGAADNDIIWHAHVEFSEVGT